MKTLKQFAESQITPTIADDIDAAVSYLQTHLSHVLEPEFKVNASISTLGGNPSICVTVCGKHPAHNIMLNSPCWMNIWIHGIQAGKPVAWESDSVNRALKFRMIKTQTLPQANEKLVSWFKKSKETMLKLESGEINRFGR